MLFESNQVFGRLVMGNNNTARAILARCWCLFILLRRVQRFINRVDRGAVKRCLM